jgi:putative transposase
MKKMRYKVEQVTFALRQADRVMPVAGAIRKMSIIEPPFYRWRKQFAGIRVTEIRQLSSLRMRTHAANSS